MDIARPGRPPAAITLMQDFPGRGNSHDNSDVSDGIIALAVLTLEQSRQDLERNLLQVAILAASLIPGAEGVGVTLLHDDGRTDTMVATAEFVRQVDAIQYGIGEGPCITAAAEGRTVHSDALGDEPQWPVFGRQVRELDVHSVLSLPLMLRGRHVLGAMNVYAHPRSAFSQRAIEIGEQFSVPAAISVQNARALAQAHRLATELSTSLSNQSTVDQALGVIMSQRGCTARLALEDLLALSRAGGISLAEAGQAILGGVWKPQKADDHTD